MSLDLVKPAQIALLAGPPQEERNRLMSLERTEANHAAALASLGCLQRLEAPVSGLEAPLSFPLTVAAWNLERCYAVERSAEAIADQGADIALLSEVDNGMARTGQRHTSQELAERLGMAYAFGVEFLELELGSEVELEFCTDDFNRHGFHGNALLAKTALQAPVMIRLEPWGHWFTPETPAKRIGTRCAIASAVMTVHGPLYAVSVHLENRGDAAYREGQVRRLLDALDELAGEAPVIIGGDLNAAPVARDGSEETLFGHAIGRGFEVHGGPAHQMTTRPSRVSRKPQGTWKIDWFLTRGLEVEETRIVPALAPDGEVLSDHEMVVTKIGGFRG